MLLVLETCEVATFVELFVSGPWMELKQVHHSHLQKLVWELPRIVLCYRASSTTSKYMGSFKRWSHWASSYGIPSIPADAKFLALYLADVLKNLQAPYWQHCMVYLGLIEKPCWRTPPSTHWLLKLWMQLSA